MTSPAEDPTLSPAPEKLAADFMGLLRQGRYARGHIEQLSQKSTAGDPDATQAIFSGIIEPLADSFNPEWAGVYNQVMAHLITLARQTSPELDQELNRFGLASEADLIEYASRMRAVTQKISEGVLAYPYLNLKKLIILSRVTLGADVAITSVIIERVKKTFKSVEIVVVGSKQLYQLFGADSRVTIEELTYKRRGSLTDRFLAWTALTAVIEGLTKGLKSGEYLVLDTDSRLTQLGMLPVVGTFADPTLSGNARGRNAKGYLLLPSREFQSESDASLSELTSQWLDCVMGKAGRTLPRVSLAVDDQTAARNIVQKIRRGGAASVVTVNLGVGQNLGKSLGVEFEQSLIACLLLQEVTIILDRGAGDEESGRVDRLLEHARMLGRRNRETAIVEVDESRLPAIIRYNTMATDILVWHGNIGMLAAFTAESDIYIGYDSAGQHIAAALGTPCIDIFAGYSSRRIPQRWRPGGQAEVAVIDTENRSIDQVTLSVVQNTTRILNAAEAARRAP